MESYQLMSTIGQGREVATTALSKWPTPTPTISNPTPHVNTRMGLGRLATSYYTDEGPPLAGNGIPRLPVLFRR